MHLYLESCINDSDTQPNLKATSLKSENQWLKTQSMKLNKILKKNKMQRIAHFKENWLGEPTKGSIGKSGKGKVIKAKEK